MYNLNMQYMFIQIKVKENISVMITESLHVSKRISQEEKFKFLDVEPYYFYSQNINERDNKNNPDLHYGVSCHDSSIVPNNGKI